MVGFATGRASKKYPTEKFEETWHDAGQTNLLESVRAHRETGFEGVLRPDHMPTIEGDTNDRPGSSSFGPVRD